MRNRPTSLPGIVAAAVILLLAAIFTGAQTTVVPSRITQAIDPANLTILRGNTHPLAQPQFDRGAAPAALPMARMLLVLKRSAQQESALDTLLEEQQDASSPNFHRWLTPQQFGQQFGPSDQDIQTITSWLQSQGFQVNRVSNGRTVIEFSGTAGEVQSAFHTSIHQYLVNGENHWANSSDPEIPTALAPVVTGIDSLYNFPRTPMIHIRGSVTRSKGTGNLLPDEPLFTFGGNCGVPGLACYGLSPYDFATIYDVSPLWNASPAIDGTGQTIAIVGESDISIQDVRNFRNYFGLPANDPHIFMDGVDPGTVPGDETESDLDVEWSGAVAKGATIDFVISATTESSLGVDLSAEYIIDNNLAPILSESYGICELSLGTTGNQYYSQLWQQAAAQGITVLVSSGDNGSAGCDDFRATPPAPAQFGLMVSGFESTPYNVSVGGTDFNDLTDASTYWSSTNTPPPGQPSLPPSVSALSYIPETAWNNSCTNAVFGNLLGYSTVAETNCNDQRLIDFVRPEGGSGGKSSCTSSGGQTTSSCTGGYPKPSWQTALTPNDGKRDVPDVSLFAAAGGPAGAFYLLCAADVTPAPYTSCQATDPNTRLLATGGTSAAAPTFAGIIALVDQKTGSRQGNANYALYKLAAQSGASCNSSNGSSPNCVFHDVTNGTNAMPCATGSPNCTTRVSGDAYGVLSGYATNSGYDQATGLGSVDASNLVKAWQSFSLVLKPSSTTLTLTPPSGGNLSSLTHGQTVTFSTSVSAVAPATGAPTGSVGLIANTGTDGQQGVQSVTLNSSGDGSGSTNALPGGTYTVFANYAGDGTFASSSSSPPISVTVNPEGSETKLSIVMFDPSTGQVSNSNATTFAYGSPYILRADVTNSSGADCFTSTTGNMVYGCPTGAVNITDNGTNLGAGTFVLNSRGYAEYPPIQLTGGAHNLAGSYSGDSSYNASSGSDAVTVTPAPTTTKAILNPANPALVIGGPSGISGMTNTQSNGAAPTGSYSVFDGNTAVGGTGSFYGFAATSSQPAECQGAIGFTIGPPAGQHTITVRYSGDQNYASSTSAPVTVNAVYPVTVTDSASPTSVVYGQNVTITATVDTNNPANNAALKPTGTVSLSSSYGSIGSVTTTTTQDANGNWMLQATATTTPQQSEYISASYSGDPNYEALGSSNIVYVTVTVPDFSVSAAPPSVTITAGQTGSTTLTVSPKTSFTSTVGLSCGGTGNVVPGVKCTISPSSVTLSSGSSATSVLSLATQPPSSNTTAFEMPVHLRGAPLMPTGRGAFWGLSIASGLLALLLFVGPRRQRYAYASLALGLVCAVSFGIGCGGGSGGGGGGGGSEPVSTTTSLSTPTTKVAPGAGLTLTATVTSSKPATGTVTFSSQSCGWTSFVNLVNGSAQVQLAPAVAICDATAKYGGDANNLPSQSGTLTVVFTGTAGQPVTGTTSNDTHLIQVNVTLQ